MSEIGDFEIACLCYKNEDRKQRMIQRFKSLHLRHKIFDEWDPSVYTTPQRTLLESATSEHSRRVISCILNHLTILRYYIETTDLPFIIVVEDDVHLHKDLKTELSKVADHMTSCHLDIVLLGCLLPLVPPGPGFYEYNSELWGTQAMMLSREYAKMLVERFCSPNDLNIDGLTFAADWIITKLARSRAYIYPMLAVEEGTSGDGNDVHQHFHNYITRLHLNSNYV
jgi:GR25 family glycosyltransferase involved in LPS biosynthesis